MADWMRGCGYVHDTTEVATDVEMVATEDVREFVKARGGRVFVWTSMHYALFAPLCTLEASLDPPKGDLGFRRIAGPGFDIYLESTQRVWPKMMEFALKRHRHVEAYWNGLGWVA